MDEELAFHIEMRTRELVEKGVDPRVAREMVLARSEMRRGSSARALTLAESGIEKCD